jgi:hypothetical protein
LGAEAFGFKQLGFGAGVEDAQLGVVEVAKRPAAAAVREGKLAEMAFPGGGA